MKIKTTTFIFLALFFLAGNFIVKGQPTEVWNQAHNWNLDRYYRGVDYHPLNNHLYVAGTEGAYTGDGSTVAEDAMIRILDPATGNLLKTISPSTVFGADWGYGIRDVEVDDAGGIFATTGTSNQYNPVQIYYWENEDADPIQLWKDASGTTNDFGGSFSVYGDFKTEALIIIPWVDVPKVYYFEVTNGVIGEPTTLDLSGLGAIRTPHVQALGTKISDGFWYNNVELAGPVKFDGTGNIVARIPDGVITGGNLDVKEFIAGSTTYLAVSNAGKIQLINITGKAADLSDVTSGDMLEIDGTVPVLETVWPHVYGSGQEQAVVGNPDGSYVIYSLSGGNYVKAVATEGAPTANNVKVEGLTKIGEEFMASYLYVDINGDAEGASEIKWYMADDAAGTNKTEIVTATGSLNYTFVAADENKYISFSVLPVASTGTASDVTHYVETEFFGPVLSNAAAPVAQNVTLTGTIAVNETLTGAYTYFDENGDAEGETEIKWWTADDAAGTNKVEVASGTLSYVVQPADDGKFILFSVTPVAATGVLLTGETVTVASATAVIFPEFAPVATDLSISGREEVDGELTGSYTYSDLNGDPEGATVIKWYRADDAAGTNMTEVATDLMTYTVVVADEGKYIIFEVTPVTEAGDTGDPVWTATGVIAAKPAPEAPVASDVLVNGTPEVGAVIFGTYTYTDRTDDPEGASIHKWYTADDDAGTNKAEISGADAYVLTITEEMVGKHLVYEITPVATTGELLAGDPVQAVTAVAASASTNDGAFERVWARIGKLGGVPEFIGTGNTERGFAIGTEHIYIASRNGGTKLVVVDKESGGFVSEMNTEGMDVGLFRISDVEVSDDGQILACPLQTNSSTEPFVVYKWENELAAPTKFIEFTSTDAMRLGDKFTVVGDVSGDAVIYAVQSAGNKVVRWVVTGGIVDAGTVITLQDVTSVGSTPAAYPFANDPDANFIVDGRGAQAQIFDKDGTYVGALEGIGLDNNQSNSPNVFYYKGRTMAAFHQKNDGGLWNIIVQDITGPAHITVGTSEVFSTANQELGGVHVEADQDNFHLYMLSANNGLARYIGALELPEFQYAETSEDGNMVHLWFSKNMSDIGFEGTGWTVDIGGTAANVDTIFRDVDDPMILTLELDATVANGDVVTVEYDGSGGVAAFDEMPLNAFGPEVVVNIVGVSAPEALDVTITGVERAGETFTADYTYSDADGDLEGDSEYQWWYATDANGSDQLKILGETGLTYVVGNDMEGKYIAFEVIPVALTGGMDYLVGAPAMSDFVRIIPVGISNASFDQIRAYPNPVNDMLTIDNCASVKTITIVDVTGKMIRSVNNLSGDRVNLDMSDFTSGLYYLNLQDESGASSVIKVIKAQ